MLYISYRLWADVFRVHGDGEYMRWQRVSDDVVPINISCIEDTPSTVFQITAYNRHVEKIFDVKITQPGTIICPATESFVHWRDPINQCEWGLNFSTATDAHRFRDCCAVINLILFLTYSRFNFYQLCVCYQTII
ncbi:hypothetical protein LOTGIDRAFT_119577 [Lottia gigantea]|uniref:WH1 domain-containing protein n=1 Tax=Lottia gigantea TaxID=225164 RepID=V4AIE9_LOTGI|nr:hypothetical protein LOTGIDRAFT_119577 [Lottia gigantea]ESO93241.1 hypothetical protein LOTGIDRAFT_119577 [Lottia gigantea]